MKLADEHALGERFSGLEATVMERTDTIFRRLDAIEKKLEKPHDCPQACALQIENHKLRIEALERTARDNSNRAWTALIGVGIGLVVGAVKWLWSLKGG